MDLNTYKYYRIKKAFNYNFGKLVGPKPSFWDKMSFSMNRVLSNALGLHEYKPIHPISRGGVNKLIRDAGYEPARMNTVDAFNRYFPRYFSRNPQTRQEILNELDPNLFSGFGGFTMPFSRRVFLQSANAADPLVQLHEQGHALQPKGFFRELISIPYYPLNHAAFEQGANRTAHTFIDTLKDANDRKLLHYLYDVSQRENMALSRLDKPFARWYIPKEKYDQAKRIADRSNEILRAHEDDIVRIFRQLNGLD